MASHAQQMDAIYRWQRPIYDLTRKYYLFGRDGLIDGLALGPGPACWNWAVAPGAIWR
jgi:S-adenosylmethionine-diacylgycerolhomoserine-N-methlytransferase